MQEPNRCTGNSLQAGYQIKLRKPILQFTTLPDTYVCMFKNGNETY